ncbi:helix-turn-helix domain-containing protein [Pelobacter propionicus]|uniref:helix-turn-helix domain-containing protein n=1 Tax=Pelobacter propionicus TaxID=29543 RepID=UPI0002F49694|nr:helix-turn-helix transcriptional regulator [Pelobacter propionicus]
MMKNSLKIKILMMQKGISGSHIAEKAGVHRTAVYHVISGRAKSQRLQRLIAQELGWSFEALWSG